MKQSEADWFRPLWRRVLVTAIVAVWCAYEWAISRDQLWSLMTSAMLAYAVWNFFIRYNPTPPGGDGGSAPPTG